MKPALVLLHGVASNATRWIEFRANTRLDRRILAPDLRGNASRALPRTRLGMDLWCADIAALLDAERCERAAAGRALNRAGIYRRKLEPLALREWDRRTRAGEVRLSTLASLGVDLRSTPVAAYVRMLAATAEPWPDAATIRVPALALVSSRSRMTDPARTRRALARLPDCKIVEIDAVHWIPTEQPEAMRQAIDDWLARRSSERAP